MKLICAALGLSQCAAAQFVSTPAVGFMRDSSSRVRAVYGIAGNFILAGDPSFRSVEEVISLAFSGKSGLAKTETQVLLLDQNARTVQTFPAPPGKALFAFHADGTPAYCYFESSRNLVRVATAGLESLDAVSVEDGTHPISLAEIDGAPSFVTSVHQLHAKRNGLPAKVQSAQPMGDGWMQVETAEASYALRIANGVFYRLPETGK